MLETTHDEGKLSHLHDSDDGYDGKNCVPINNEDSSVDEDNCRNSLKIEMKKLAIHLKKQDSRVRP